MRLRLVILVFQVTAAVYGLALKYFIYSRMYGLYVLILALTSMLVIKQASMDTFQSFVHGSRSRRTSIELNANMILHNMSSENAFDIMVIYSAV